MITLRQSFSKLMSISVMVLACSLADKNNAFAQVDTTSVTYSDSLEVMPLQKFDFGVPNPNADKSKVESAIDFLKIASSEEIHKATMESTLINSNNDYSIMTLEDDNTEYAVGQIPYQEDVTPYGGRIYNIPIMVSPMSDFPPQISLQYNSQAGNGLAGFGWSIGGLSSITLTNKNQYYHGTVAPATLSGTNGAYLLDGVPLVQNDDSSLSSEYQLETAKGHILVKKHMSASAVCYFTALYPDGSKATYGMTSNTSAKTVYPITLWEDRLGNQITYTYSNTNSDYRVTSIQYKHKNNSSYVGRINFSYSARTDYHTRYTAGQSSYQNYILKSITSISNGSTLCTYNLSHELKDGANLLTSIGCTNSSGEQLRPLRFDYGSNNYYGGSTSNDLRKNDYLFLSSYFSTSGEVKFIYNRGKMMASNFKDGLVILPSFSNYGPIDRKLQWFTYRHKYGSIYSAEQDILIAPNLTYFSDVFTVKTESEFQCINTADIDGDGVDEIVKVNFDGVSTSASTTGLKVTVYGTTSSGVSKKKSFTLGVRGIFSDNGVFISPVQRCYMYGDFRGDGKTQLLTISFSSNEYYTTNESYASLIDLNSNSKITEQALFLLPYEDYINGKVVCLDMDGDGKTELCHLSGSTLNIYNLEGNNLTLTKSISTVSSLLSEGSHFTDINGDGQIDIAIEPIGSSLYWYIYCYNGQDFTTKMVNLSGKTDDDEFIFFDITNDGLADLIQRNGTSTYVYLNENANFNYANRITSTLSLPITTEFVSCNVMGYNSMSDFITIEDAYVNIYGFSQDLGVNRLLTKFTNSLGSITINNYADMAGSDYVYQVDATRTYSKSNGYAKCRFPLQLLYNTQSYLSSSQTEASMLTNLYYTYFDACVHTKGLGFCGFGKVRTTNFRNITNKELVAIETRSPESMGVTTRLALGHRMTHDTPYNITDYTYDANTTTYGKLNPRLTKETNLNTLTNITTTTSYTYGDFDYPKTIAITYGDGSTESAVKTHSYVYEHKNTAENYVLGTLVSSLKGNIVPSQQKFWYEKQVYTHNDQQQPVTCIEYVGASSTSLNKKRETRWIYDTYGNILSEMVSPYNATEFIGKTYSYDSNGINLMSMTNELGQTTTFANYNKFGKALKITDHKGRVTTDEYDAWGKLKIRTMPDGTVSSTSEAWGGTGCYTITTSIAGKPKEIAHYDAAGREVRSGSQRYNSQLICKIFRRKGR